MAGRQDVVPGKPLTYGQSITDGCIDWDTTVSALNLLAEAEAPLAYKLGIFSVVFLLTLALTVYTMAKSKKLSDFLDALSDERLTAWQKCKALALVWRTQKD